MIPGTHSSRPPGPDAVLDFWFADGLQTPTGWPTQEMKAVWFGGGPELDERIKSTFGAQVVQAVQGGLEAWEEAPSSRLALVILLDQFTRNVFRGTGQAFAGDARAQRLVMEAMEKGWDLSLPCVGRVFFYMPLMHAEDIALQNECVSRFTQLLKGAPEALKARLQGNLDFAVQHRDIIMQFGRFPHRNKPLGRPSTSEETVFLQTSPRFGQ
jgi:uncharacterized protein (DUF924 family)